MAKKQAKGAPRGVQKRQIGVLVLALLLLAGAMGGIFYTQTAATSNQLWLDQRLELRAQIELFAKIAREASQGLEPDFRALTDLQKDFGNLIQTFRGGDPVTGMAPLPDDYQLDVEDLQDIWDENQDSITAILENAPIYQRTTYGVAVIIDAVNTIKGYHADLRAGPATTNQLLALELLGAEARSLTGLSADSVAVAAKLKKLESDYLEGARILTNAGGDFAEAVTNSENDFATIQDAIAKIAADAETLFAYQDAAAGFLGAATNIITAGNTVEQDLLDVVAGRRLDPRLSYGLGIAGLALLLLFIIMFLFDARRRVNVAMARDASQQKSILELLDEITNLADGDLTVDVSVSEDFTGAIADSINYTVGSMRSLVGTINDTSVQIASAASDTAERVRKMNQASERQAKEVTNVTNAIVASSDQLQQVATRAEALAQDAQKSVDVAHNGAETVSRTIVNMTTLREQIQDTAKRIKRLGESSQEIGNIIEFINDIAEQTNTLALNASIQAAMAGDQGRGFAVVADEVQRLAERAANATRQIENLVKTIQADTTEAIVSMERSTANVVAGAKSAEEAGQALTQIESASNDLARLIQEISGSARTQSAAASKIAGTMQVIRDIAVQTSGSAAQTVEAVGNLNTLSEKLRESVSGFKLPNQARA